jgi:rubredoxin
MSMTQYSRKFVILESLVTCPHCGTTKAEIMRTDACRFFYECTGCGVMLRPKQGDCCVFCSYGSLPCPPIQAERSGEVGTASCGTA